MLRSVLRPLSLPIECLLCCTTALSYQAVFEEFLKYIACRYSKIVILKCLLRLVCFIKVDQRTVVYGNHRQRRQVSKVSLKFRRKFC
jgi:hypothetical protein